MDTGNGSGLALISKSQFEGLTYPCVRLTDFILNDNLQLSESSPDHGYNHNLPETDLNTLDVLPLELLQVILSQLDVWTLIGFRLVNRRAMEVVDSIPQYKAVVTHARDVIRGILSIKFGQWISCETIYEKLCTAECEQCGDFGGYFYIIACKRVCFLCLSEDKKYLPLRYGHAIAKFGVNRQILKTLPCMRSIPGTYSPTEKKVNQRLTLVAFESAYRAGVTLHGSVSAMEQYVSETAATKMEEFERVAFRAAMEGTNPSRPRWPRSGDVFEGQSGNPMRFMAIVRMPWLNRVTHELEWGFHCIGCQKLHYSRPLHFRRKFTVATFDEHLRQCGDIRDGKHLQG